jgi:hypothetical protein
MMNKNTTKYSFAAQTLILFAVTVLILMLLARLVGDGAKEISPLYQLGSKGLASVTLLQFLFSSAVITALKEFFYSDQFFKKLMTLWRTIFMLFGVLAVSVLFIIIFQWFPLNNWAAWAGFLIFFGGSCFTASIFMIIKTKLESKRYDELLSVYKEQHESDNKEGGDENE